jgi:hypothetical protein
MSLLPTSNLIVKKIIEFLNIDLSEFDFINERPITNFYKNMKEINIIVIEMV